MILTGKSASSGIAIARAVVVDEIEYQLETTLVGHYEDEIQRFNSAVSASLADLKVLFDKTHKTLGEEKAQIFEAHSLILQDPELIESVHFEIKENTSSASVAVEIVTKRFITMFEEMDSEYMRERASDIKDISQRLMRKILNLNEVNLNHLDEDSIIVAKDISPSQMASLDLNKAVGIITEIGGKTSHTAIMARSLEIAAVVGVSNATKSIKHGDLIILDGDEAKILINPDSKTLQNYQELKEKLTFEKKELLSYKDLPSLTLDGRRIHLEANIATINDLKAVVKNGAEGIGLFRTEFIYMDRKKAPSEEEQFEIYKTVLQAMGDLPVVIRTLDVGGDKHLSYLDIPKEENPFLGLRAIRYCLQDIPLFKTQVRALLRASVFGNLGIMFPMISSLEEIIEAKKILGEVKTQLTSEGIIFSNNVRTGMMIEVPAAAIMAQDFAPHVDFFSIGTNDLIQYVCAVDRMNERIHSLYDTHHPAVLRLIHHVIEAGRKHQVKVAMCGEMAGNESLTEILLGMGLNHLSMSPGSILKIKKKIRETSLEICQEKSSALLQLSSSQKVREHIRSFATIS